MQVKLTPNVQIIRRSLSMMRRLSHIQQIAIDVVLEDEARGVKPVVKDLAAHDVPADAPAVGVPLVTQPIMTQNLGVEVVRLEGGVVHVHLWPFEEEEAVVVYQLVAAVKAEEDCFVYTFFVVHELFVGTGLS